MVSLTSANVQCEVYRHINVILDIGPPLLFFCCCCCCRQFNNRCIRLYMVFQKKTPLW